MRYDTNLTHYPLRDYKNIWNKKNNIVKDYDKIGKCSCKKDDNHLNNSIFTSYCTAHTPCIPSIFFENQLEKIYLPSPARRTSVSLLTFFIRMSMRIYLFYTPLFSFIRS